MYKRTIPQQIFLSWAFFFEIDAHHIESRLAANSLSSWNYRCIPPYLAWKTLLMAIFSLQRHKCQGILFNVKQMTITEIKLRLFHTNCGKKILFRNSKRNSLKKAILTGIKVIKKKKTEQVKASTVIELIFSDLIYCYRSHLGSSILDEA